MYSDVVARFATNNIQITPGGIWELSTEGRKHPIDALRQNHQEWAQYPKDNMGKHYLQKEQNILIVDIDGEPLTPLDDGSMRVDSLDLILPATMYTVTSSESKFHFYYNVADATQLPNRLVGLNGSKVDIFTYGNIFDGHFYSPSFYMSPDKMVALPQSVIDYIDEHTPSNIPKDTSNIQNASSNVARYNLINAYIDGELTEKTEWNAFFRSVYPKEFIEKGAKKLTFQYFDFSYDLINKIATKLTMTRELGTEEHIRPALRMIIAEYDRDPNYMGLLDKQILGTLPITTSEKPYHLDNDDLTILEHTRLQTGTSMPIFRVIFDGKVKFIELSKHSLLPIMHNGNYFLDLVAAKALHPERAVLNEAGQIVGWDDQVPIVYVTDSPYELPLFIDQENNRSVINLYKQTEYLKRATPTPYLSKSNLFYKLLHSSIHPDYVDLVMQFHAQVVFGPKAPTIVVWIASLKSDKGGTGKSIITIDLLARILGTAGTVVNEDDMAGNWGDVLIGARVISLEDLPNLGTRQFDKLYSSIKQATSSAQKRLNMKGVSFRNERLNIALTGSSNERLALHPSDRRFLCLEPAHLRGHTEPLSSSDAILIERFRHLPDNVHHDELQEYTDYLAHLQQTEMSESLFRDLFIEAPETTYRTKWVTSGQSNTQNVVILLKTPKALHDTVRVDELNVDALIELYQLLIDTYSENTQKTAVPWNWFQELLPFVQSQEHAEKTYSKAQVSKMLSVDFTTNVGEKYSSKWLRKWKQSGIVYDMDTDQYNDWVEIIDSLKNNTEELTCNVG